MKVTKLGLRNFRNIAECEFFPDPKLNFLIGPNGQGKTSFLEALGFLSTLRSFKNSKIGEAIRWSEDFSELRCTLNSDSTDVSSWMTDLKIVLAFQDLEKQRATKTAFINQKAYKSSTNYLSQRFGNYELGFHSVVFNPSDHDLVRGEPSLRRSYLDRVLAAESGDYLKNFQKYQKTLEHRNAVLKDGNARSRDVLTEFSQSLCRFGAILTLSRLNFIRRLSEHLNNTAQQIAPKMPFLRLIYQSNWVPEIGNLSNSNNSLSAVDFAGLGALPSLELLEQEFWNKLSSLEAAEWRTGHSLVGPHRDDWGFYYGSQPLRGHGSQGEVRTALLALKLCEIELFRAQTGHRPLFLLDDFSSELDRERRSFLMKFLTESDLQVFVTGTDESAFHGKRFWVLNGNLVSSAEAEEKLGQGLLENVRKSVHN